MSAGDQLALSSDATTDTTDAWTLQELGCYSVQVLQVRWLASSTTHLSIKSCIEQPWPRSQAVCLCLTHGPWLLDN